MEGGWKGGAREGGTHLCRTAVRREGASKQVSKAKKQLCGVYSTVGGEGRLFCALVKRGGGGLGPRPRSRGLLLLLSFSPCVRRTLTLGLRTDGRRRGKDRTKRDAVAFARERERDPYVYNEGGFSVVAAARPVVARLVCLSGRDSNTAHCECSLGGECAKKDLPPPLGREEWAQGRYIGARPRRGEGRRRASIINIKEMRGRELGRGLVVGMQRRRRIVIRNAT